MLTSMTISQYKEWLAFFKIRNEEITNQTSSGKYGASPEGQKQMGADLMRAMQGYQQRRDRLKG